MPVEVKGKFILMPFTVRSVLIYHILKQRGEYVSCFFDNDRRIDNKEYNGCRILYPGELIVTEFDLTVILCEPRHYDVMEKQLDALGVKGILFSEHIITAEEASCCLPMVDVESIRHIVPGQFSAMERRRQQWNNFAGAGCMLCTDEVFIPIIDVNLSEGCSANCDFCKMLENNFTGHLSKAFYIMETDFFEWFEISGQQGATKQTADKLIQLLKSGNCKDTMLFFEHSGGGGSTEYLESKLDSLRNRYVFIIIYVPASEKYLLYYKHHGEKTKFCLDSLARLKELVDILGVSSIHINELSNYPDIQAVINALCDIRKTQDIDLVYYIHDYISICPTVVLLNNDSVYCGLPEPDICDDCIINNRHIKHREFDTMVTWRKHWGMLLDSCDEIVVFSNSSKNILLRVYPNIHHKLTVQPHTISNIAPSEKWVKTSEHINIGIPGNITDYKGAGIVYEMQNIIKKHSLHVRIIVIGTINMDPTSEDLAITGIYHPSQLPELVVKNNIDLLFIPSICPETFSYTTQEAIQLDMPVAVFNLGAPAERVSKYKKGLVIDEIDAETALFMIIEFVSQQAT